MRNWWSRWFRILFSLLALDSGWWLSLWFLLFVQTFVYRHSWSWVLLCLNLPLVFYHQPRRCIDLGSVIQKPILSLERVINTPLPLLVAFTEGDFHRVNFFSIVLVIHNIGLTLLKVVTLILLWLWWRLLWHRHFWAKFMGFLHNLCDVLSNLFGKKSLQILVKIMFPTKLTCKLVWIVPFQNQNRFVLTISNLNRQCEQLLTRLFLLRVYLSWLLWLVNRCFESSMCVEMRGFWCCCRLKISTCEVVVIQKDVLRLLMEALQVRGAQTSPSEM